VNPFDLRGPQFLVFYGALSALVLLAVVLRRRPADDAEGLPSRIDDAYQLAVLRDGPVEAVRVAVLSLLDRRLLKAKEGRLQALAGEDLTRRPLERAVLARFQTEGDAAAVFGDPRVTGAIHDLEADLTRAGLVSAQRGQPSPAGLAGAAVLAAVAVAKIGVALSRGRTNVLFLVAAALLVCFGALIVGARPRLTRRGEKAVELARRSFARLRTSAASLVPGGGTNELALAFAVFGYAALPPLARELLTEARVARTASGGGSSCGSSCGASWSSSSSCGGSSCGGGCGGGGCGGCGS
jgi:uncharacterized protein (TIGR04222 family)